MREFHGSAEAFVAARPEAAFDVITDIEGLPEWNAAIEAVTERPDALDVGAEWVVVMHPPRLPRWRSRSRVEELDHHRLRFTHRTRSDDGNPTFVIWMWEVVAAQGGAQVSVTWDAHVKTIGRRLFAARMRRRALEREVPASLASITHITTQRRIA